MLAPISNSRRDGGSSFRKLKQYILTEKDPVSGKEKFRGDYFLSDNLLGIETAHREMVAVAAQNPRVKDPIYHFQICWHEGEQPTREQWEKAMRRSVEALGFREHQYIAAAHENTKNFHIHVMVNRVHPEEYNAHAPFWDMATLDKVMREVEHEDGWVEDKGNYRWDVALSSAVRNTFAEMAQQREATAETVRGVAAKIEHHNGTESFYSYAPQAAAKDLKQLMTRDRVTWREVHSLLAAKGLQLEKAEKGGYTVRAVGEDVRAKASVVFRETFAGKQNRETLERKLGPWQEPGKEDVAPQQQYAKTRGRRNAGRDKEHRDAQRNRREDERKALVAEFFQYRNERRKIPREYTARVRGERKQLVLRLREQKAEIRKEKHLSWADRRAALSLAAAEAVVEQRLLTARAHRERLALGPVTYQQWVAARAGEHDRRAIAQLRGWRYQDQRNVRKIEREILNGTRAEVQLTSPDPSDVGAWAYLANDELRKIEHAEVVTQCIAQMRVLISRNTGHVSYTLAGKTALIDRGKAISVISRDEAATVLALEMAVKKYGHRIAAHGSDQWKREIAQIAARHRIFIEFTDSGMQATMAASKEQEQNPRTVASQQKAEQWRRMSGSVLKAGDRGELRFPEADMENFMDGIYGEPYGRITLRSWSRSIQPGSRKEKGIVGGQLAIFHNTDGTFQYRLTIADSNMLSESLQKTAQRVQTVAKRNAPPSRAVGGIRR